MKRWLTLMTLCVSVVYAQEEEHLYELVKLGKNVNTRYHESAPIISPDGNTLYFFVSDHPENKFGKEHSQDIWYSEKDENGDWGPATHMDDPLNNRRYNQVMSVSRDGRTLLVRGGVNKKDVGFSTTRRLGPNKWSKPVALKIKDYQKMDQGRFSGACMSSDGKVLLMYFSERKEHKFSDIYVSFLEANNLWSRPKRIQEPISTYKDEFGPFLAANNKTLYFASNRSGGKGSMDLYKTTRLDDTWLSWSEPENMGPPLNTGGFDAYYSVDASGMNAFTTRAYMSADGGSLDILGVISIPNLVVSGYVRNKDTNQPLEAEMEYHTEGIEPHFFVSDENGFYRLLLHDKRNYLLSAFKEGFNDLFDSVDLSNAGQEEEITKDFYMIPKKPEILLFGLVLDQSNNNPLAADFNYKAQGVGSGSFSSDAEEGYFSVKLPDQGNYYFRVKLEGYKPLIDS
ncbi:MAG: hypothetical protein O7F74_12625, partial [Bacteroidetes bacterium]|nr:hypothetical protein [Bacteroidota bacterium]